jgi:hypothetical protein
MVKTGKLTKSELFYIESNPDNMTIHELAKELDRTPKLVAKHYVEKVDSVPEEQPAPPAPVANPEAAMFKLMGRHERKGKHVATVMTSAASELADATRSGRLSEKNKMKNSIHKPKG